MCSRGTKHAKNRNPNLGLSPLPYLGHEDQFKGVELLLQACALLSIPFFLQFDQHCLGSIINRQLQE